MKDWIVETRAVSRRVYHVQAHDEKEAISLSTHNPPESDEDEYEETMSVVEHVKAPYPSLIRADRDATDGEVK
jgi:hypothetical protein